MRISDWSSDVCSSDLHFYSVMLEPLGDDRTRDHFEIYYFDEAVRGDGYADLRATNARQWRTVFEEDRGDVAGMQAGRAPPALPGRAFPPPMAPPTPCFHPCMANRKTHSLGKTGFG